MRLINNPYTPSAGEMPLYLAGRDDVLNQMDEVFEALSYGMHVRPMIFTGLRGVGKTVLMNVLQENAIQRSIHCDYIEMEPKKSFVSNFVSICQIYLQNVSMKEKAKTFANKAWSAIKSLSIIYNPNDNNFKFSLQEKEMYAMSTPSISMTNLIVSIGQTAKALREPFCLIIDELQYIDKGELSSLLTALHRVSQLGLPVLIIGAGLPKLYKMLASGKTYSERLFQFEEITSLDREHCIDAIIEPIRKFDIHYTQEALDKIFSITNGYPHFIQQLCFVISAKLNENVEYIDIQDVDSSLEAYYNALDKGFYRVRYDNCSDGEKRFMYAMVDCGDLPCTISNVAKNLNKSVRSISPTRGQLINKGIIYSTGHSEIDFTVPEFDLFLNRIR